MFKIAIIEDNEENLRLIIEIISETIKNNNLDSEIVFYTTKYEQAKEFILKKEADIYFIDIELKSEKNGLDLAKIIYERNKKTFIVFITAHIKYILHSGSVSARQFLVKPSAYEILGEEFLRFYNDFIELNSDNTEKMIEIKCIGSGVHKVKPNEIIYVEKSPKNVVLICTDKILNAKQTLTELEEILSIASKDIVKVHKSFLCNKKHIISVKNNELKMSNNATIPVGRAYKDNLD